MENASKALLIAGSVLIAVLLIALGVRVFNTSRAPVDEQEKAMQTTEMAQFNSKFTQYVGSSMSRAQVMSLINVAISNNANSTHQVTINGKKPENVMNSVTGESYTVTIGSYDNGYISNIQTNPAF